MGSSIDGSWSAQDHFSKGSEAVGKCFRCTFGSLVRICAQLAKSLMYIDRLRIKDSIMHYSYAPEAHCSSSSKSMVSGGVLRGDRPCDTLWVSVGLPLLS